MTAINHNQKVFAECLAPTNEHPLSIPIAYAKGSYIYDIYKKKYLDFTSGVGVNNIGHRHPKVIEAIKNQLDKYLHIMPYGECIQGTTNKLAEYLTSLLPTKLDCCYFVNSGAEANEGAIKLAKRATGRTGIVSCHNAYHGSTHGALSISGESNRKNAFRPLLPNVQLIHFGNHEDLHMITHETACVIMETIQSDAGVQVPSIAYLKAVRKRCNEVGTLLILDEVQCGMGRTGTLFAFEQFDITPDILTMAKALGGGLPLGAFIASKHMMRLFAFNPALGHITTFGGNPVACASGLATLKVTVEKKLSEKATKKGEIIDQLINHPSIVEKRRIGMMIAIDFDNTSKASSVIKRVLRKGVLSFYFLSRSNSMRISPPLTITTAELQKGCRSIMTALQESEA